MKFSFLDGLFGCDCCSIHSVGHSGGQFNVYGHYGVWKTGSKQGHWEIIRSVVYQMAKGNSRGIGGDKWVSSTGPISFILVQHYYTVLWGKIVQGNRQLCDDPALLSS